MPTPPVGPPLIVQLRNALQKPGANMSELSRRFVILRRTQLEQANPGAAADKITAMLTDELAQASGLAPLTTDRLSIAQTIAERGPGQTILDAVSNHPGINALVAKFTPDRGAEPKVLKIG